MLLISLAKKLPLLAVLLAASSVFGLVSPAPNPLLPLVPAGAESVAGIEDPHNPKGHLLIVAGLNNFDLEDWLSLAAVDDRLVSDRLIWAVTSSRRGELREHMLLVAGRFDRERIFTAARTNGAAILDYHGLPVLVVAPFAREQRRMPDVRWLAILDNQVAIFGTPDLVRNSLDRRAAGAPADPALLGRLSQLGPGVNSWNTMAMASSVLGRHLVSGDPEVPWSGLVAGADGLTLGIHYGSTARIDFALHFSTDDEFARAAGRFSEPGALLLSAHKQWQPRLKSLSMHSDLVAGSVSMPGKQLDAYIRSRRTRLWINSPSQATIAKPSSNPPASSIVNSLR